MTNVRARPNAPTPIHFQASVMAALAISLLGKARTPFSDQPTIFRKVGGSPTLLSSAAPGLDEMASGLRKLRAGDRALHETPREPKPDLGPVACTHPEQEAILFGVVLKVELMKGRHGFLADFP